MADTPTFTHKNITIQMMPSGKFVAIIGGCSVVKDSLSAVKKTIDAAEDKAKAFPPFKAFIYSGYRGYEEKTVVGVKTKKSSYGTGSKEFQIEGCESRTAVAEISEKNKAFIAAVVAYEKETARIREEREAQQAKLEDKIRWFDAATYPASAAPRKS